MEHFLYRLGTPKSPRTITHKWKRQYNWFQIRRQRLAPNFLSKWIKRTSKLSTNFKRGDPNSLCDFNGRFWLQILHEFRPGPKYCASRFPKQRLVVFLCDYFDYSFGRLCAICGPISYGWLLPIETSRICRFMLNCQYFSYHVQWVLSRLLHSWKVTLWVSRNFNKEIKRSTRIRRVRKSTNAWPLRRQTWNVNIWDFYSWIATY